MKKEEEKKERKTGDHKRRQFQTSLREELIKSIESGVPRSVIVYQYGMSRVTLSNWMRDHASKEYQDKQRGNQLTDVEKKVNSPTG